MFDLSKLSTQYRARYMNDSDADTLLNFCLQNDQYYRYCGKQPSTNSDTAFIGFFMMNRQLQGRQIGTSIIQELCLYLKETGLRLVLLGIDKENLQSNAF